MELRITINPRNKWADSIKEAKISTRELEALILHGNGNDNSQTAALLEIKYQTVKNLLHSVTKKLGTNNVTEAVLIAIGKNLLKVEVDSDEPRTGREFISCIDEEHYQNLENDEEIE